MAIVFKTPKSALNTTSKAIQNLGNGECPPCPECPEVNLETADVNYTENGEYTLTPEGDGFSKVDITVNVDTETPYNEGYAAGETAGIATGKAEGIAEQKAKLTFTTITENGTSTREDGWNSVTVNVIPDLQAKTVNPSTSQQTVVPDQGKDGLSTVTVNAVTNAIDANIQAGNIKSGVTILGVTGNVEEANFEPNKEFLGDVTGVYTVTPERGYNGFDEVQVTVESDPTGSFWNPFDVTDNDMMADVYTKLNKGEYFDGRSAFFSMEVESGSIDSKTGYYVAEDANGNSFTIKPYLDNPDYNPELSPEDQPDVPQHIFPENFDLSGLSIQVQTDFANVTITENKPEDPAEAPTYTVEAIDCVLNGINWNSDMESWHYYWEGAVSGDIEASTRNLSLSTNIAQTMSIASPEAWEIELDEPTKTRSTKGLLKVAQPTLEIDKMSGDAGVFTLNVLSTKDQNTGFTVKGLDSGNELHIDVNSMGNYFTIESLEDDNEISWDCYDDQHLLEYSLDDGTTWERITLTEDNGSYIWSETINTGDTIRFRGNNAYYAYGTNSGTPNLYKGCIFKSTGTFNVYGDIRTLLNANNALNATYQTNYTFAGLFKDSKVVNANELLLPNFVSKYCYDEMFMNCVELATAPELPATSLSDGCYYNMFYGCSNLQVMPELPATYLAESCYYQMFALSGVSELRNLPADYLQNKCYDHMFYNCNNLTSLDEFVLPATHLATYCYQYMFAQCPNLVNVNRNMLPATSLKTGCYQNMFDTCRSLVASPELPATNLAQACYANMFYYCVALTTAPELPATTLVRTCYSSMFANCDSLEKAPILPAATLTQSCYNQMFIYCHKLNTVTCLATDISASSALNYWLSDVAAEGTFYKNPEMTSWPTDSVSGIPTGWTVEDYVEPSN